MSKTYYLKDFLNNQNIVFHKDQQIKLTYLNGVNLSNLDADIFANIRQRLLQTFFDKTHEVITTHTTGASYIVRALGFVEYRVSKLTGLISCYTYDFQSDFFSHPEEQPLNTIELCLPLKLTSWLIEKIVFSIDEELQAFVAALKTKKLQNNNQFPCNFKNSLIRYLTKWLKQSIKKIYKWRNIQYAVKSELHICDQDFTLALQSRWFKKAVLSISDYNNILNHYLLYLELNYDNAKLLWLLSYLLSEGYDIENNAIKVIKDYLISKGLTEQGWRVLTKSNKKDYAFLFKNAIYLEDLIGYLKLHCLINRRVLLPRALNDLFNHPHWRVSDQSIYYRGVIIPPQLFSQLIDQYLIYGLNHTELNNEVSSVLIWLREFKPKIDHNQLKKPWKWFANKALKKIAYEQSKLSNNKIAWDPIITRINFSEFEVIGIQNKWQLMQLAIQQRHCIDSYGDDCLSGNKLVFVIYEHQKIISSILLEKSNKNWWIEGIRGFANREATDTEVDIAHALVDKLDEVSLGFQKLY